MTALSTLEAYDLLRHCATLTERIARAEVDQLSRAGLEDEKVWLHQALERVEPLLPIIEEMLRRCRELPELIPAREDHAQVVQGAWVDALERLVGALTHHAGSRAPILETLFPHLKFPPLRRASPEVVRAYAADLERRSRLGYVKRIFSGPDFAFAEPLVLEVFGRLAEWEACFEPGSLTEEEAAPLREELAVLTATVERHMRQARLLAEASLCPVEGAFEASGIGSRPRRRVGNVEVETPPGLDPEPTDDGVSLVDALGWGGSASEAEAGGDEAGSEGAGAQTPGVGDDEPQSETPEEGADAAPSPGDDAPAPEVNAGGGDEEGQGAPAADAEPGPQEVGVADGAPHAPSSDEESSAGAVAQESVPSPDDGTASAPTSEAQPSRARGAPQKKRGRKAKASRGNAAQAATDVPTPNAADAPEVEPPPSSRTEKTSGSEADADAAVPVAPKRSRRGRSRAAAAAVPSED